MWPGWGAKPTKSSCDLVGAPYFRILLCKPRLLRLSMLLRICSSLSTSVVVSVDSPWFQPKLSFDVAHDRHHRDC